MFVTHYLIVMIIYYKLPTADFLQHTQVFMKVTSAGASRMMRTMNKALCIEWIGQLEDGIMRCKIGNDGWKRNIKLRSRVIVCDIYLIRWMPDISVTKTLDDGHKRATLYTQLMAIDTRRTCSLNHRCGKCMIERSPLQTYQNVHISVIFI